MRTKKLPRSPNVEDKRGEYGVNRTLKTDRGTSFQKNTGKSDRKRNLTIIKKSK